MFAKVHQRDLLAQGSLANPLAQIVTRKHALDGPVIEARRAQLSFAEGLIDEEVRRVRGLDAAR